MRGYEQQPQDGPDVRQHVRERRSTQETDHQIPHHQGILTPDMVLALQRSVGNAAVVHLMRQHACDSSCGQQGERAASAPTVQRSSVHDVLRSRGRRLDPQLQSTVEAGMNAAPGSLNHAEVIDGPKGVAAARDVGATAFTSQNKIVGDISDRETAIHEAIHVLQQSRGPVSGTDRGDGIAVSDPGDRFEREAATEARRIHTASPTLDLPYSDPSDRFERAAEATATQAMTGQAPVQRRVQASAPEPTRVPMSQNALAVQRAVTSDPIAHTEKNGRAGRVSAQNIRGKPLGLSANSPSVDPHGWTQLNTAGHTLSNTTGNNSHYNAVRMHLMNGRLGGPGNQTWNLAPGPATTNSSMSAGPETAAKDAVENGRSIWLETEVFYQNITPLNANDFRTVVPNRMTMEWGYMIGPTKRDAAQPPTWDEKIDQPAGALDAAQQNQYRNVTSWSVLKNRLDNAGDQERAQAYSLVKSALRKNIILEYPQVYQGLAGLDRTAVLLFTLTAAETVSVAENLYQGPSAIVDEVLSLLYSHTAQLQAVFQSFSAGYQVQLAVAGGLTVITHLGAVGRNLAGAHWEVFSMYDRPGRRAILDPLSKPQIDALLRGHQSNPVIHDWHDELGMTEVDDRENHASAHLSPRLAGTYRNTLTWYGSGRQGSRRSERNK